jgi:hypothetical protein
MRSAGSSNWWKRRGRRWRWDKACFKKCFRMAPGNYSKN